MSRILLGCLCLLILGLSVPTHAADDAPPDFGKLGRPFLAKYCIGCHGGKDPKGELSLEAFQDASALVKQRKIFDSVVRMVVSSEMPPKDSPQPTVAERQQFADLIKAVFDHSDRNAKPDPGRVTMRRLNRREYANTVRDLLGADFNPTEDFPSDDVGHGFDNIGDVLTLSPLLMERYLTAAETISARVILANPPKPAVRHLSGRFLQPNNAQTPQGRFRQMSAADTDPTKSGPFMAPADYLKLTPDADLHLRANLYAETKGTAPVKVALFLSGAGLKDVSSDADIAQLMGQNVEKSKPMKILKVFEITEREAKKTQLIEFTVNKIEGVQRAGVALVKPPEGEEIPQLFIEHIWSEGPLETRPASHIKLLACSPDKPLPEQTREVVTRLLNRAFRRPASSGEIESFTKFVERSMASGKKWEESMQLAVQAVLVSPKFLFRVELDSRSDLPNAHPIDEFQLASRLSYFLWSTMPDDELTGLAARGELTAKLDEQVRRMLRDPKAESLVDDFAMQWLQLGKLQTISPDPTLFPTFTPALRQAMLAETRLCLLEIMREDRSLLELLSADYTYVNEPLARHYGITDTLGNRASDNPKKRGQPIRGAAMIRVPIIGGDRGGLLTQASILTVTSNPTRTSPVKRGRWVLEQVLGTPPPPPPPNVPELEAQKDQLTGSLRQRMEQHRKNPACANCHAQMDAIGFAFEHFDATGKYREKDGEFDIDTNGTLPDGRTIAGAADLKQVLAAKKELLVGSLTEKLMTYGLGRGIEYYDRRPIEQVKAAVAKDDYKFSRLIVEIVRSEPFRMRRGKDE